MSKRALLIALVVAVMGVMLMLLYVRKFEQQASGGERVQLLVAIKPIERGSVITDDVLAVREVPLAYVEDRAVKSAERAKVVGLRVGNNVQSQQTLMWTDLAIAADERRDLSGLVQPGSRAVSVRARSGDKSFSLIRPGDYVDVVAIMPEPGSDRQSAVVLLQKVLVLAVGLETSAEFSSDTKDTMGWWRQEAVLTLSLHLQEAQLVALAVEKGQITVALRHPEDQRIAEKIPNMSSSTLTDSNAIQKVQQIRSTGPIKLEGASR